MKRLSIDNPLPGGEAWIFRGPAKRAVAAGYAVFSSSTSICLLNNAHDQAEKHIADAWLWEQRQAKKRQGLAYDHIERMMTLDELPNIPVVCAEKLIRGKPLRKLAMI